MFAKAPRQSLRAEWHMNILQNIRYAFRLLRMNPGFMTAAALTLALGIGANAAIYTVINAELLRPLPFQHPERLVALWESNPKQEIDRAAVSPPNYVDWSSQSRTIEQIAAYRYWGFVLTGGDAPERIIGARASASLFSLLGVKPILGRTFLPEEDRSGGNHVVLIREGLWQRRFGASRWRMMQQLLTESVLIAFLGGSPGLLLAQQGTNLLLTLRAASMPPVVQIGVDRYVLGFTLLLSLLTGPVLGLFPACLASRPDWSQSLKEGRSRATQGVRLALSAAPLSSARWR